MASTKPAIDPDYYRDYAGSGRSYDSVYRDYSYSDECIALFTEGGFAKPKSLLVLGPATGKVLSDFDRKLGLLGWGCEINEWAWSKIPARYRAQIENADMLDYLTKVLEQNARFDLCFTNALGYLGAEEAEAVIDGLARVARYVHFHSSFLGSACPDPYRKTLKPLSWWIERFERAGFRTLHEDNGTPMYLWSAP